MNIKQFSELTHVSAYTLRYYEKIGLLKTIACNSSGHRYFTEQDVIWVGFIKRLKETGMPLASILHYAQLHAQGEQTNEERIAMLTTHALALENNIRDQQQHLTMLNQKIAHYTQAGCTNK